MISGGVPILISTINGDYALTSILIKYGAIINLSTIEPQLVGFAMLHNHYDIIKLLLENGAILTTENNYIYKPLIKPDIQSIINEHLSSKPDFANLPQLSAEMLQQNLSANPDNYHDYQCNYGDNALAKFINEVGLWELVCTAEYEYLKDEL
jgi:hypothetical protein